MENTSDIDIAFSQYAQDPLEDFSLRYPDLSTRQQREETKEKKSKTKRDTLKRKLPLSSKSYVISKEKRKGTHLIQIKIFELKDSNECDVESEDNIVISAQYMVNEGLDDIMDETKRIVNKICKNICNDNFY